MPVTILANTVNPGQVPQNAALFAVNITISVQNKTKQKKKKKKKKKRRSDTPWANGIVNFWDRDSILPLENILSV